MAKDPYIDYWREAFCAACEEIGLDTSSLTSDQWLNAGEVLYGAESVRGEYFGEHIYDRNLMSDLKKEWAGKVVTDTVYVDDPKQAIRVKELETENAIYRDLISE